MAVSLVLTIPSDAAGKCLSEYLRLTKHSLSAPCGGRGVCKKCHVKVRDGQFLSVSAPHVPVMPDKNGCVLACCVICPPDGAIIELIEETVGGLTAETPGGEATGTVDASLDIGTTTLAIAFVKREGGQVAATSSCLNPQKAFGGDVISRIAACRDGYLRDMRQSLLCEVNRMASEFFADNPFSCAGKMTVAGNPTMLHIFCGISPESMGMFPFTPVFTEKKVLTGEDLNLPFSKITILPSSSAFIGSDVVNGVQVCKMRELDSPSLLIDIGTNGEMIICTGKKNDNRLLAASAAAGPALEGASISCGVGGVTGGVSKVKQSGIGLIFSTVNDGEPIGLCGSGLVDLIACLLDDETIDETGCMEGDFSLTGVHKTERGMSDVKRTPVSLTQKDVREFQLAKSAIRAGIDILLDTANLKVTDISRVFLAGGLGCCTNVVSAVKTGLFPKEFLGITNPVGNTALQGAINCLDERIIKEVDEIAKSCETISLNECPKFADLFTEYMLFPEEG